MILSFKIFIVFNKTGGIMRLFSIIIAVYNVEMYLEKCLDSLIGQTYTNWEVILVDDGSVDNSASICDVYAEKDKRIKVFHRLNKGSLLARRFGLYQAQGDYFLFIDSDDFISNELLNEVDQIINKTNSDLVIYRFQRFGGLRKSESPIIFKEGTIIGEGGSSKKLVWDKVISGCEFNSLCLKVVKRECIDFEIDYEKYAFLKFGTDLMQSLAILDKANRIYFTEKVYYYYRLNETGISKSKSYKMDLENIKMLMMTRKTIFDRILFFLKKNNYDSQETLEAFYIYYAKNEISSLINWISNEKNNTLRRKIIQLVMEDAFLKEGVPYIKVDNIPQKYRQLYRAYKNNEEKKFTIYVYNYARIKKIMDVGINALMSVRRLC